MDIAFFGNLLKKKKKIKQSRSTNITPPTTLLSSMLDYGEQQQQQQQFYGQASELHHYCSGSNRNLLCLSACPFQCSDVCVYVYMCVLGTGAGSAHARHLAPHGDNNQLFVHVFERKSRP